MQKFTQKLLVFMAGRYGLYARGFDTLCKCIFFASLAFYIAAIPFRGLIGFILRLIGIALFAWCVFRFLSKDIHARQRENMGFIRILDNIKLFFGGKTDGDKKIFRCPKCRTKVRVPKGRGKIRITCPKCKAEFIKRS